MYIMHTYLQKTSQTSDQVHQNRPEKLDQKVVGCWALSAAAAAAVAFAHQQSLCAILAAQSPS